MTDWQRWQGWRGRLNYWKGFVAYHLVLALPLSLTAWLLPIAGDYVEWDNAIEIMREEMRIDDLMT